MARLFDTGIFSANATNGSIGVGYKLNFYTTGTSTQKNTYPTRADAIAGTNANANPVVALSDGRWPAIWLTGGDYKVVLTDFDGNTLKTRDPADSNLEDALSVSSGSAQMGFIQSGTGAVAQTQQGKDRLTLDAADFGVVGNPSIADDTAALQLAINFAASTRMALKLPPQLKCGALTIPANTNIIGVPNRTQITALSGSYNMFTISGSDVSIENLNVLDAAKSGGWDFIIACGSAQKDRIFITNVNTLNSRGFITDSGSGSGVHTSTLLTQCQLKSHNGPGVQMTRAFAFIWFTRVVVDYVGVSTANYYGFALDLSGLGASAGGVNFTDCDVLGTMGTFANANQRGFDIRNATAIWITNSRADTCCEIGWLFYNVNLIHAQGLVGSLCDSHALWLETVTNAKFEGLGLYGRNYLTTPSPNADGLRLVSGCSSINITGGEIRDFTGHGIDKVAAQSGAVLISGTQIFSNTGRAIKTVGNSGFLAVGCQFGANNVGNYDLGGNSDYIQASQLNAGTIANVGPGPVTG